MNFPCPIREPCLDDANPFQNLSSEAPDPFIFYAYGSGPGSYNGAPGTTSPQAGRNYHTSDCDTSAGGNVCTSTASQEEANLCVQRLGNICQPPPGTPPPAGPPTSTDGTRLYQSNATSCTVNCSDGSPFTFVLPFGAFVATSQILADRQAMSYACRQAQRAKVCFSALSPVNCCYQQPYTGHMTVSGAGPFTFSLASGSLPPGLTLTGSGNTATITGTPTGTGNFTFAIKALATSGIFVVKTFTLPVIGFTNINPTTFTNAQAYSFQFSAVGGTSPYTFALDGGSLPTGLSISSSGLVSGTPNGAVSTSATIKVTDSTGASCSKAYNFSNATKTGFMICRWDEVKPLLTVDAPSDPSSAPEWDGIFDLTDFHRLNALGCPIINNLPFWYFINQAIDGKAVSVPDLCSDYPNDWGSGEPPGVCWQENCFYSSLFFSSAFNTWSINLITSDSTIWYGELSSANQNDPSGVYDFFGGDSTGPLQIEIRATGYQCCADVGDPVPANWGSAPARVRVHDIAALAAALAPCPGCNASASPAWDGTMPVKCTALPDDLHYAPLGPTCPIAANATPLPPLSLGGFSIHNGVSAVVHIEIQFISAIRWSFSITCIGAPNQTIWGGEKLVGDSPVGRYIRRSGAAGGIGAGPVCIDIESY